MPQIFRFRVYVQPRSEAFAYGVVRAGSLAEARAILGHRYVEFEAVCSLALTQRVTCAAVVWIWASDWSKPGCTLDEAVRQLAEPAEAA
ncbi:MAG: hypothetical protein ACFBRM_14275 [Pikeienuella sp.]